MGIADKGWTKGRVFFVFWQVEAMERKKHQVLLNLKMAEITYAWLEAWTFGRNTVETYDFLTRHTRPRIFKVKLFHLWFSPKTTLCSVPKTYPKNELLQLLLFQIKDLIWSFSSFRTFYYVLTISQAPYWHWGYNVKKEMSNNVKISARGKKSIKINLKVKSY